MLSNDYRLSFVCVDTRHPYIQSENALNYPSSHKADNIASRFLQNMVYKFEDKFMPPSPTFFRPKTASTFINFVIADIDGCTCQREPL